MKNTLVLFGAGKIGRSFIGQLFSLGGYEVVFIDISKPIIDELNKRGSYRVIIKDRQESVLEIKNVRGVCIEDEAEVVREVSNANLLAVSVGQAGLPSVIRLIANGLLEKYEKDKLLATDLIIAENLRDAAEYFRMELSEILPTNYPLNQLVGLVETSIGKMVPIMQPKDRQDDPLLVYAEAYNTLILDQKAFRNPIPAIAGLAPKENMKAWVDLKLFIHNLGHAAAAYLGYLYRPEFVYIYEALEVPEIFSSVRAAMLQAAKILQNKYPGEFSDQSMNEHINDLLSRFANKALGDTIFRVGCDLARKLGPNDRLAGAINLAMELELPYDKILVALVYGCHFRAADASGIMLTSDQEFGKTYGNNIARILEEVCLFDPVAEAKIFAEAADIDRKLREGKELISS